MSGPVFYEIQDSFYEICQIWSYLENCLLKLAIEQPGPKKKGLKYRYLFFYKVFLADYVSEKLKCLELRTKTLFWQLKINLTQNY